VQPEALPLEVAAFITEYVRSVMSLELLLMMRADPRRSWDAGELSRELRSELDWTARELDAFARRGVIASDPEIPTRYRFAPADPSIADVLARIAALYPERRFSIIQCIYAAPSGPLKSFADAFKLRKE
jgi:hypothetical protein